MRKKREPSVKHNIFPHSKIMNLLYATVENGGADILHFAA